MDTAAVLPRVRAAYQTPTPSQATRPTEHRQPTATVGTAVQAIIKPQTDSSMCACVDS